MLDSISEERLALVHPLLARKIQQMADILAVDRPPVVFRVTQGLRTWNEQALLYAEGRTGPGAIVTNAPPGHSYHNFGLAVDLVPLTQGLTLDWNVTHPVWKRLVQVGTSLGLTAGAQFRSFPDYPHFQLTGSLPASPDDNVRKVFQSDGIVGVWKATGLEENV